MSRYVDLDGVSWDGKPISSKIQEVQTKQGYLLQGITAGWLWGDNVPHIDLEEHDKQIRADAIEEFVKRLKAECSKHYVDCDPYFSGIADSILYEDDIDEIAEELKEQNK